MNSYPTFLVVLRLLISCPLSSMTSVEKDLAIGIDGLSCKHPLFRGSLN